PHDQVQQDRNAREEHAAEEDGEDEGHGSPTGRALSLPQPLYRVRIEDTISAHERHLLDHGLCNQEAIEGIAMMVWQVRQDRRVLWYDGENEKLIVRDFSLHESLIWLGQRVFSEVDLDGYLPVAGWADGDVIVRIDDQALRRGAQLRIIQ